jgi:hypothetical protein
MNFVTELLANTGYIMYNKTLAKLLGVNESILIGEFCAKYQYWLQRGELIGNDGWFFIGREEIEGDTGLSPYQQRTATQALADSGVLQIEKRGTPARNWYYLDTQCLENLMLKNCTTSDSKTEPLDVKKLNHSYNNKDNKKENKEECRQGCTREGTANIQEQTAAYTANPKLLDALTAYLEMRKQKKKPPTPYAYSLILKKLDRECSGVREKIAVLEQSIVNGWTDIYPLKEPLPPEPDISPPVELTPEMDTQRVILKPGEKFDWKELVD